MKAERIGALIGVIVIAVCGLGSARAGDDEKAQRGQRLHGLGIEYERALSLADAERQGALSDINARLSQLLDAGVEDDRRFAGALLHAELLRTLGDFRGALEKYGEAADRADNNAYVDDILAARIEAIEAAGGDSEALRLRDEWLRRFSDSPIRHEVMIAHAWNALRADSLPMAIHWFDAVNSAEPRLADDPRVQLGRAVIAYQEGRYADVNLAKSGSELDAAVIYLQALVEVKRERPLKAAAKFQSIVDRYPASTLRDRAMLAKANIFLVSKAYPSAAEDFARVGEKAGDDKIRAEAQLRSAAAVYLSGDIENGVAQLRQVSVQHDGTDVAARAQMMLAEALVSAERYEEAIVEYNVVLRKYFQHSLAATAQYRVGRCLDALDRGAEATSAYQAVVSGYPISREAPAAAYLAGSGLITQGIPRAAAPYFQVVLDRYAGDRGQETLAFETPERQELVEAALCLLLLSYHRTGDLGLLSGVPHMVLERMPPSDSVWRAYALLIDADAMASQGRYEAARSGLDALITDFPRAEVAVPALQLLAWTHAQLGNTDLAMGAQKQLLDRFGSSGEAVSTAYLNRAHILFNDKNYKSAADAYATFLSHYPDHDARPGALYQMGMCFLRLGLDGDAVDRFDKLTSEFPTIKIAEKAWTRAGDVYFRSGHYEEAKRCYTGLLEHFADSDVAAVGMLRIGQCDYNAGRNSEAIETFSAVIDRFPSHPMAGDARRGIEQAMYRLGQSEDGMETLTELVERFPGSSFAADAQYEIAARMYDEGDYEGAAEAFRRVVSQFPGYASADRAQYLMADALDRAGQSEAADLAYEQFMTFFPESEMRHEARLRTGASRFADGDYMSAAVEFTSIMEDSVPAEIAAAALFNLALCRKMLSEPADAIEALENYKKTYGNDERAKDVSFELAELYDDAERTQEAADQYLAALEADIDGERKIVAYYRLGACRETLEDFDGAMRAYAGARRQPDRSNVFRLTALARAAGIYESRGEYSKAIKSYKDISLNAGDSELGVIAKQRISELESIAKQ